MIIANQTGNREPNESRRKFLKNSGYAVGGLVVGGVVGSLFLTAPKPAAPAAPAPEAVNYNQALMYFKQKQFLITEAATERIFPGDEDGSGAKELFETEEVKLTTISASGFFKTLFSSTLEGVYADPLYGGNNKMGGWKMKYFPGNQMSYIDIIEQDQFVQMPPVSLREHLPH